VKRTTVLQLMAESTLAGSLIIETTEQVTRTYRRRGAWLIVKTSYFIIDHWNPIHWYELYYETKIRRLNCKRGSRCVAFQGKEVKPVRVPMDCVLRARELT
jgi:hypothetical protein